MTLWLFSTNVGKTLLLIIKTYYKEEWTWAEQKNFLWPPWCWQKGLDPLLVQHSLDHNSDHPLQGGRSNTTCPTWSDPRGRMVAPMGPSQPEVWTQRPDQHLTHLSYAVEKRPLINIYLLRILCCHCAWMRTRMMEEAAMPRARKKAVVNVAESHKTVRNNWTLTKRPISISLKVSPVYRNFRPPPPFHSHTHTHTHTHARTH